MQLWDWKSKELEEGIKNNPSPITYTAFIKHLQNKNNTDRALEIAEQAKSQFPYSESVFKLYYSLAKNKFRPQIEALKESISSGNTASLGQLAEIYKELREEEEALNLCRSAIEKTPNSDSPYLIMGEIRLRRFYKDLLTRDGDIARKNLEKAFEINPKNYKTLLFLAKFYLQIGAASKAKQRLKSILLFAPEDENIKKLLEIVMEIQKPPHEDIELLLQTVEQERRLFYSLDDPGTKRDYQQLVIDPTIFQKALDSLKTVPSILCLFVCDVDGNLIAHYSDENVDYNTYYEVASSIFNTVQESSKRMDIGKFQRSQIEGPFGTIHILDSAPVVYIIFGIPEVKAKQVFKELQKFTSQLPLEGVTS